MNNIEALMQVDVEALQHIAEWLKAEEEYAQAISREKQENISTQATTSGVAFAWTDARTTVEVALESKTGKHPYHCCCVFCESNPTTEAYRKYQIRIAKNPK